MDTRYFLELTRPPSDGLRDQLIHTGAKLESALTGWALPSEAVWQSIEKALRKDAVDYDLFFEFIPGPDDSDDDLVAFLPLIALSDAEPVEPGQLIVLRDEETSTTMASARLVALLEPATEGLVWEPVAASADLHRLSAAQTIPEPIVVPHAVFRAQGIDGEWAVQSDGRELLTAPSWRAVQKAGAAFAPECSVDGAVLRWLRPLLLSGRILRLLRDNDVQGIAGSPVYLGRAD